MHSYLYGSFGCASLLDAERQAVGIFICLPPVATRGVGRRLGDEPAYMAVAQAGKPNTLPTRTPAEVAHLMVLAIEQVTPEQNGKFYSVTGKEVPW